MSDHFTLDVDPEQLRTAATNLSRVGEQLKEKGREVGDTPGQIGEQWTGAAAVSVLGEMTALGTTMSGFWTGFDTSGAALRALANDYEDAQTQVTELTEPEVGCRRGRLPAGSGASGHRLRRSGPGQGAGRQAPQPCAAARVRVEPHLRVRRCLRNPAH